MSPITSGQPLPQSGALFSDFGGVSSRGTPVLSSSCGGRCVRALGLAFDWSRCSLVGAGAWLPFASASAAATFALHVG